MLFHDCKEYGQCGSDGCYFLEINKSMPISSSTIIVIKVHYIFSKCQQVITSHVKNNTSRMFYHTGKAHQTPVILYINFNFSYFLTNWVLKTRTILWDQILPWPQFKGIQYHIKRSSSSVFFVVIWFPDQSKLFFHCSERCEPYFSCVVPHSIAGILIALNTF